MKASAIWCDCEQGRRVRGPTSGCAECDKIEQGTVAPAALAKRERQRNYYAANRERLAAKDKGRQRPARKVHTP